MPSSGIVPASRTPAVLPSGQRTLTARFNVRSRYVKYTLHHTDPRRRIVNLDDVADHDLVAQCDEPEARRPRHDPVAEQSGANPLDGDGRLGVLRRGRFGCGHAVVLFCFLASSLASSAR